MGMIVASRGCLSAGGRQRASALRRRDVAARLRRPCAAGRDRREQRFVQRGEVRLLRSQTMRPTIPAVMPSPATRQSARPSLRAVRRLPVAGGRMARSRGAAGRQPALRPGRVRRVCRGRWRPRRPSAGTTSSSRLRRLHGRRSAARRRPLREEPAARGRHAGEPRRHDLRPPGGGRAAAVHRRPAVRVDAAVDARRRHHLRAVLRPAAVSRHVEYRGDAVHHADRLGAAGRSAPSSAPCSPPSPSPSAPSRCR